MQIYLFDGTTEGLFTAIFEWFERKPGKIRLQTREKHQPDAFYDVMFIHNDHQKATRVWKGLEQRLSKEWIRRLHCCCLAENEETWIALFEFCCSLFTTDTAIQYNYGDPNVLLLSQTAKKVEREKHRMEAFIRFQETADGIYYCGIDPDFNVIPLLQRHFQNRYADQQWIIYDLKRKYGIFYNKQDVQEIQLDLKLELKSLTLPATQQSVQESLYALLWQDYFKSTNIPARKNTALHIRHVPKRYWKYLTEKQ
ncbi:TIGR03915 family putative DNA repair protein [Pedobacter antarcticus]|uniref:TIGR03915 family putative DNA repair protein n=1 Tax=Pedobacter antarcticus TaxID=34086 RepID=UPI002930347D|nr:TIGR03915 family putative DNA repair protein [Pedobacter antarcticus]